MLVHDLLAQAAVRWPDKVALVCGGKRHTWQDVDGISNRLANALRAQGVGRGDRVAIYLPNCVETVVGIFAVLKAGAVFVMVNPTTKREKLEFILNDCGATAILADAVFAADGLNPVGHPSFPTLKFALLREKPGAFVPQMAGVSTFALAQSGVPATVPSCTNIDLDLACLIYTSGSTGEPKGVMCDHSNVVFVTESIVEYLRNTEKDIVLSVLPLSFSYGLYQLVAAVRSGAKS